MDLFRNIEEIHTAVLDITRYELVPTPEFPGTARYISAQDCFLQKEARMCISDAIVIEDNKFK